VPLSPSSRKTSPRPRFVRRYFFGDLFDRDFSLSGNHDGFPISKNAMRADKEKVGTLVTRGPGGRGRVQGFPPEMFQNNFCNEHVSVGRDGSVDIAPTDPSTIVSVIQD
jgi:hypothetical protein